MISNFRKTKGAMRKIIRAKLVQVGMVIKNEEHGEMTVKGFSRIKYDPNMVIFTREYPYRLVISQDSFLLLARKTND